MKKKILLCIAFLIAVAFASTSCSPNPGTGPSPNPTATSGAAVNIMVIAQMSDNSGVLGIEQFAVYAADGQGATLTAASVTLTGPTGSISVTTTTSNIFTYSAMSTADYVPGGSYTVTVNHNSTNYSGTFTLPGNMTIAADGSTVTWPYTATAAIISVTTPAPAMVMHTYGPSLTSPYNLTATGVYSAGSGSYNISAIMTKATVFSVTGGTSTAGLVTSQQASMTTVIK